MSTRERKQHYPSETDQTQICEGSAEKPTRAAQAASAEERSKLVQVRAYGL
jgi:hypothetical protein